MEDSSRGLQHLLDKDDSDPGVRPAPRPRPIDTGASTSDATGSSLRKHEMPLRAHDDDETEKTIDPLTKDLEENLFLSDLFEESAEDSYSDEDSDEDTDEDVYDLPEGDLSYDCNWGEEETDDEEEPPRKEPPVCEVCFKDKAHWSGLCPLLDCIPNPRDTTVGENYIIVCQCCGEGGEEGEEDPHPGRNWVGRAVRDPASVFYINPNPDYCPIITDYSEVSTPRKLRRVE